MGKQRQKHSDSFKAKVALDAIRGMKTLAQLSSEYQVHQSRICAWKKLLLSNAADLFSSGKSGSGKSEEELTAPLYEQIGRLQMDLNWLKKSFEPASIDAVQLGCRRQTLCESKPNDLCTQFHRLLHLCSFRDPRHSSNLQPTRLHIRRTLLYTCRSRAPALPIPSRASTCEYAH